MRSRVVLFGGTFDPIHNAHLEIARTAADRFNFEKILFVPAANPPHKTNRAQAPYEDRIRMAQLACECDRRFEVSRIEEGSERSYSITTIEKLKECGIAPIGFLIGADAFAEIESWHRWKDVVHSVEFIVVTSRSHLRTCEPASCVETSMYPYRPSSWPIFGTAEFISHKNLKKNNPSDF